MTSETSLTRVSTILQYMDELNNRFVSGNPITSFLCLCVPKLGITIFSCQLGNQVGNNQVVHNDCEIILRYN